MSTSTQPTQAPPTTAEHKNVLSQPLSRFSLTPPTGYFRDGYCRTSARDSGNHAVAGILSDAFLDFSASRGNDLRAAGLSAGCKWCLCAGRWREAFDAFRVGEQRQGQQQQQQQGVGGVGGGLGVDVVPRIVLSATHESALKSVRLEDLKMFAIDADADADTNSNINAGAGAGIGSSS